MAEDYAANSEIETDIYIYFKMPTV
jgi:hypothetical protein